MYSSSADSPKVQTAVLFAALVSPEYSQRCSSLLWLPQVQSAVLFAALALVNTTRSPLPARSSLPPTPVTSVDSAPVVAPVDTALVHLDHRGLEYVFRLAVCDEDYPTAATKICRVFTLQFERVRFRVGDANDDA